MAGTAFPIIRAKQSGEIDFMPLFYNFSPSNASRTTRRNKADNLSPPAPGRQRHFFCRKNKPAIPLFYRRRMGSGKAGLFFGCFLP